MRFAILVFGKEENKLLSGAKAIAKAARARKHTVSILKERELYLLFDGTRECLHKNGKPLPKFDAVIVRPGFPGDPSIHAALIRQFELEGFLVINGHVGVHRAKNKVRTLQLLHHHQIPMPKTVVLFGTQNINTVMNEFQYPVIVKSAYGAGGSGIFIAESRRSLKPVVEYLLSNKASNREPIKIQEYIGESKGKDLRLFVVGKKVVAAMQRSAQRGEFRSNFHKGGNVKAIEPTEEENTMAVQASREMGLDIGGVDILRTKRGPMIIEVNSYPGVEGIAKATGKDIGGMIVKYVEKKVNKRKARTRKPIKEKASTKTIEG
jgi:ribosomal protein S6--L-glutamate ligase